VIAVLANQHMREQRRRCQTTSNHSFRRGRPSASWSGSMRRLGGMSGSAPAAAIPR
jgi:hypothetical protein